MYLPGTHIEVVNPAVKKGKIHSVLFDFDGTISLLRTGWPEIMEELMVEVLKDTPRGRELEENELRKYIRNYIATTAGLQTIYQMMWLAKKVLEFGGIAQDPKEYKQTYNERLFKYIADRLSAIRHGGVPPDTFVLPGAREFLEKLCSLGVRCYLASGTDEVYVKEEARLLRIDQYFAGIYGARDDWREDAKRRVVKHIIQTHGLQNGEFVAFGDGFVEIKEAKAVKGIAVGVASDEYSPGRVNLWKRDRLVRAGADIIIPDFREYPALLEYLFSEGGR